MKFFIRLLSIAGIHFALTQLVSVLMRSVTTAAAFKETAPWYLDPLTLLATLLYLPVITLALYPRQLFPGNLIWVPIAVNSLVWSLVILGAWRLAVRGRRG